jgi:hypothetical protein
LGTPICAIRPTFAEMRFLGDKTKKKWVSGLGTICLLVEGWSSLVFAYLILVCMRCLWGYCINLQLWIDG